MLTFLLKIESARFCIRNENSSVHHRLVDHEHYWGNYLPRLWQSFQWWKWFQETLQTIPQEKRVWLSHMWEEILYRVPVEEPHWITLYKCEICDKKLLKSALNGHKQTHQDCAFKCETCDNVYTRKNYLEKHMKTCGADIVRVRKEVIGAFTCDACGKAYLSQHKRTHAVR